MNIKDAILTGKKKAAEAREVKLEKALLKSMTTCLFIRIFNSRFREACYGIPAGITKKDVGMLKHLINHLSTELDTQAIANLIGDLIYRWRKDIAGQEFNTVSNKKITMPTRPNLRAFLSCKNDIVSFLTQRKEVDVGGGEKQIIPR